MCKSTKVTFDWWSKDLHRYYEEAVQIGTLFGEFSDIPGATEDEKLEVEALQYYRAMEIALGQYLKYHGFGSNPKPEQVKEAVRTIVLRQQTNLYKPMIMAILTELQWATIPQEFESTKLPLSIQASEFHKAIRNSRKRWAYQGYSALLNWLIQKRLIQRYTLEYTPGPFPFSYSINGGLHPVINVVTNKALVEINNTQKLGVQIHQTHVYCTATFPKPWWTVTESTKK